MVGEDDEIDIEGDEVPFYVMCICSTYIDPEFKTEHHFELEVLAKYKVVRSFLCGGILFYELDENHAGEPCCQYRQSDFVRVMPPIDSMRGPYEVYRPNVDD